VIGWYDNQRIRVTAMSPAEYVWLREFCTIVERGGVTRLLRGDNTIGVGMLSLITAEATAAGYTVNLLDRRITPSGLPLSGPALDDAVAWLRPHQRAAVNAVIANGRGIISIPTGGGKGELIPALARAIPIRWVVCVHRSHLLDDLASRYERHMGATCGRIGDGVWDVRHVTIATLKTLFVMRQRDPERFAQLVAMTEGLIVDEAHTTPASTHEAVVAAFDRAYYQVALSATALSRGDGKNHTTFAHYGPPIHTTRAEELVALGYITAPRIEMIRAPRHKPAGVEFMEWSDLYAACIAGNPGRNALVLHAALRATKPAVVFVIDIDQGEYLTGSLIRAGVRARFISGASNLDTRKRAIADLGAGNLDVVVATNVFNEGVDVQGLRSVVNAAAGKSVIATLQRIGRSTRIAEGKTHAEVYDIRDAGVLTFEAHARARIAAYRSQGYTPEDLTPEALLARPVQLRSVLYRGPDAALYAVTAPAEGPAAAPAPTRPRKAPSRGGVVALPFRTLTPPTAAPDTTPMPPAPTRPTP
jgi:superfamily II DNA or RNA helicase